MWELCQEIESVTSALETRAAGRDVEQAIRPLDALNYDGQMLIAFQDTLHRYGLNDQLLHLLRYDGAVEAITGVPLPTVDMVNFGTNQQEYHLGVASTVFDAIINFFRAIWQFFVDILKKINDYIAKWRSWFREQEKQTNQTVQQYKDMERQASTKPNPPVVNGKMQEPWASKSQLKILSKPDFDTLFNAVEKGVRMSEMLTQLVRDHQHDPAQLDKVFAGKLDIQTSLGQFGLKSPNAIQVSALPNIRPMTIAESQWTMPDLEDSGRRLVELNRIAEANVDATTKLAQELTHTIEQFKKEATDKNLSMDEQKDRMAKANIYSYFYELMNLFIKRLIDKREMLAGTRAVCINEYARVTKVFLNNPGNK